MRHRAGRNDQLRHSQSALMCPAASTSSRTYLVVRQTIRVYVILVPAPIKAPVWRGRGRYRGFGGLSLYCGLRNAVLESLYW